MKLWLISQNKNTDYDTYSDAVVAAETEEEARKIHPHNGKCVNWWNEEWGMDDWTKPENVKVKLIGTAKDGTKKGVICASFHAG